MQTIMIVEDDPDIRDGVRILLSGEGYRILEAENGPRALNLLTPEVDLVILDIMMPGMSGLRVCEEIRKISTVPILFIKKHWKPITAVICAAAVAAAVLVPKNSAKPAAASAQYVETRPEKRNIVNSYSADGTITAADTYTVKPMVKGTVLTADFEVGDTVNKGNVRHLRFELPRDDAGRR